jgi:phospholipase/carboxylesterase
MDVRIVGRGDRPVVLCHGFGAPGDDLVPLGEVLTAAAPWARFVFPVAPISLGPAMGYGRAWWHLDLERLERRMLTRGAEEASLMLDTPAGLDEARGWIEALLDELAKQGSAPPVLGGFSQGAMLSVDVAARTERPLAGLVALSGTLLAKGEWAAGLPRRAGLPVFHSHGTADPLLPFAAAEELRELLIRSGLEVAWVPFVGAHEIPPVVLDRLTGFLSQLGRRL